MKDFVERRCWRYGIEKVFLIMVSFWEGGRGWDWEYIIVLKGGKDEGMVVIVNRFLW